ncbi:hypothetical protein QTJ16_001045 [Diplocarpon rosae]|uniref:Uncharacterized protein n=1 Tax=Diplocarpon rosae TaxID=946125 RepID=A0AAD9WG65_9HELO|nr:hypothetical protein QTJ16_001045 [Diplocarpon rosae]
MHESMMAQNGMDHDHHQQVHESEEFGNDGGWCDIHHNYSSSPQHQSPLYEQSGFTFTQPFQQNTLPTEQAFSHRMPIPHHSQTHTTHQPLLPLIMPSHQTWPSMLTNPATYSTPPVAISSTVAPLVKGNSKKQQAHHPISSPRKTLTDSDRRRMCQYHEENPSVKQTEIGGTSPTSPKGTSSSSPVSTTRSEEDLNSKRRDGVRYLSQEKGGYRHSNSQSTTSLSSAFDTGPTSPTTPFTFSPDPGNSWLSLQPSQSHPPGTSFQRPRSQTFPMLGIDPSLISSSFNEPLTPKYSLPGTAPSSSLDSPSHEMPSSFVLDSALDESNESAMGPQPHTTTSGLQSPPVSVGLSSPTQDDARRALETFLSFVTQSPNRLVDENEYMTVVKLTERLRLQPNGDLPGGLHRIAEQDCEPTAPKMEQSMSVGC